MTRTGEVVSPYGMCRELISDYAPTAIVIVLGRDGLEEVRVMELLPCKYKRS